MAGNDVRRILTHKDHEGNEIRRAKLQPVNGDPTFGTDMSAGEQPPWAPFLNKVRNQLCWFNDDGDLFCAVSCKVGDASCCQSLLHETLLLQGGDAVPTAFDPNRTHVFIDVDNMNSNLDLTTWQPTAPTGPSVEFRFRKLDNSAHEIIWTDPVTNVTYSHVDRQHEFMTLAWDGVNGVLSVA